MMQESKYMEAVYSIYFVSLAIYADFLVFHQMSRFLEIILRTSSQASNLR